MCQEIKWTVCPWLQLYICFYFLKVSAERIEQCVRWTRNIHGGKQTIKKTTWATPTQSWLPDTEVSYSYFRQLRFFFVELRHDVFVTVHHSWVCVRVKCVWMCTRADRAWAWRRACVHGGGAVAGNMCENVYVLCNTGCVDSLHPRQREELWEAIYRYIVYRVSSWFLFRVTHLSRPSPLSHSVICIRNLFAASP